MAKRQSGAPSEGFERIAAALSLKGSERAAATFLGIGRGTLNGILRGTQKVGSRTVKALERMNAEDRAQIDRVAARIRPGEAGVKQARTLAAGEKREAGSTVRQVEYAEQAALGPQQGPTQADLPDGLYQRVQDGRLPGETVESAVRRLAGDDVWAELQMRWAAGVARGDWYELAIMWEYEGDAGDVGIAEM